MAGTRLKQRFVSLPHAIEAYAVRGLSFVFGLLPFSFSCWLAKRAGDLFYVLLSSRRKIGCGNLERVYGTDLPAPEKRRILRQSFQNTALSILELFLIKKMKPCAEQRFTFKGLDHLKAALSRGKGVVLITSHLGSWEYLGFLPYLTGIPCSVIVKNLKNAALDREIDNLRRETSLVPIPKRQAIREALDRLATNEVVAILIDQWAGPEGLWNDFMGLPTSTTSLPARLAEKTGCALVAAYCLRKGTSRYEIELLPQLPFPSGEANWEASATARLNESLEAHVRKHPEQWSWAHRRWKPKPSTSRQAQP
ncbi:MAG: lysophospholipid acyltransferase family protein [Candidatus Omnitrophota bacterium]|jgi:KDO2-lipid IV(A) lauroyltransferase